MSLITNPEKDNEISNPLLTLSELFPPEEEMDLNPESLKKIISTIQDVGKHISLPENPETIALKDKISSNQATLDDTRQLFLLFLRQADDHLISTVLKLDTIRAGTNENKQRAIQEIITCFKQKSPSLSLVNLQLSYLPSSLFYYLNHLTKLDLSINKFFSLPPLPSQLIELDCSMNKIIRLPSLPSSLMQLSCFYNSLTSLPSLPQNLKKLECYGNELITLPSPLPPSLTCLYCANNHLVSLPTPLPQNLNTLDCYNNNIFLLPPLPQNLTWLCCYNNNLSALPTIPQSLRYLDCSRNYLTPQFANLPNRFELGTQKQISTATNILSLFKIKANDPSVKNLDESYFSDEPALEDNIHHWLRKLKETAQFQHTLYGPIFATQVLKILQYAQENSEYRNLLRDFLVDALESCQDRAINAFTYLEIHRKVMIAESKNNSLQNLFEILMGSFALQELYQFAKTFLLLHPEADEIEVYLKLQIELKKDFLEFPIEINTMNYSHYSKLEEQDVILAKQQVKQALANSQQVVTFLLSDITWTNRLKKEFQTELNAVLTPVYEKLESLEKQQNSLNSEEFIQANNALLKEKEETEKTWLVKKTTEVVMNLKQEKNVNVNENKLEETE